MLMDPIFNWINQPHMLKTYCSNAHFNINFPFKPKSYKKFFSPLDALTKILNNLHFRSPICTAAFMCIVHLIFASVIIIIIIIIISLVVRGPIVVDF